MNITQKAFQIVEKSDGTNKTSKAFDVFIISLILLNVLSVILESHQWIYDQYQKEFFIFEQFSVVIFTIEYIIRLVTSKYKYPNKSRVGAILAFVFSFYGLVDLSAIIPSYFILANLDLRFIRILRLFRLFRLFKFGRYSSAMSILIRVIKSRKEELLLTIFMSCILIVFSASLIFFVEREAQPGVFSSITKSMWWAVATLTTVGYGDMYPVTPLGDIIASFVAVMGIGLVALPTGIIGTGFIEEISRIKSGKPDVPEKCTCPKCGNTFDINTH
ncbi:ion transporter [Flammeovirga sp. EKP202]|uniref:ion transporter n=1 Tax=Flammeovirga sp. EKP202 TaxID=2770592 RepID=UPI00165F342B|nr:ion transporter [Flammeovirga sp. EKP202]MBD0402631.1 ion transporter [Flammeovirga sp. EKP202]